MIAFDYVDPTRAKIAGGSDLLEQVLAGRHVHKVGQGKRDIEFGSEEIQSFLDCRRRGRCGVVVLPHAVKSQRLSVVLKLEILSVALDARIGASRQLDNDFAGSILLDLHIRIDARAPRR